MASGGTLSTIAWFMGNATSSTHLAALRLPNARGLYDTIGHVQEWAWDWFGEYPLAPQTDPVGPSSGTFRLLRGGAWNSPAPYCRAASRMWTLPSHVDDTTGVRLVQTAP